MDHRRALASATSATSPRSDYFPTERLQTDLNDDDAHYIATWLTSSNQIHTVQPGFQESYGSMFPAPRQRWVDAMVTPADAIAALPHETLIVHGREDAVIPLQNSYRLLELIPNAQLHVFGRCGHWSQIEHAATFNRLVANFLTQE